MRGMLPGLLALCLLGAGCGGDDASPTADRTTGTPTPVEASEKASVDCSDPGSKVAVRDLTGKPAGYRLVQPDRAEAEKIADQFKRQVGGLGKDYDVAILARRGSSNGMAVFVFNTTEPATADNIENVLTGAEDGARDRGVDSERITVAGRP